MFGQQIQQSIAERSVFASLWKVAGEPCSIAMLAHDYSESSGHILNNGNQWWRKCVVHSMEGTSNPLTNSKVPNKWHHKWATMVQIERAYFSKLASFVHAEWKIIDSPSKMAYGWCCCAPHASIFTWSPSQCIIRSALRGFLHLWLACCVKRRDLRPSG